MGKKNAQVSGFSGRTIGRMIQKGSSPSAKASAAPKKGKRK